MKTTIKFPSEAEIDFNGKDCGIGCQFLEQAYYDKTGPQLLMEPKCHLFKIILERYNLTRQQTIRCSACIGMVSGKFYWSITGRLYDNNGNMVKLI